MCAPSIGTERFWAKSDLLMSHDHAYWTIYCYESIGFGIWPDLSFISSYPGSLESKMASSGTNIDRPVALLWLVFCLFFFSNVRKERKRHSRDRQSSFKHGQIQVNWQANEDEFHILDCGAYFKTSDSFTFGHLLLIKSQQAMSVHYVCCCLSSSSLANSVRMSRRHGTLEGATYCCPCANESVHRSCTSCWSVSPIRRRIQWDYIRHSTWRLR
jgi:hypothetical protein